MLTADPDSARVAGPSKSTSINDGTKDIGSAPSRYLFLRGLDSLVTEFEIAESFQAAIARKAAAEGYQPGDGGLCRIMLVKDRQSTASWGFAFAEYADVKVGGPQRAPISCFTELILHARLLSKA